MSEQILGQKTEYQFSCEIKENSKGEPAITIKVRSDQDCKSASDEALKEYLRIKLELTPKA